MKHFETKTVEQRHYVGTTCDRCGMACQYPITVVISVHEGEEGGRRDEYDYCDDCLVEMAPALVAAGSRAELVTGEVPTEDDPA